MCRPKTVDRYAKPLSATYEHRLGGPLLTIEGKGFARAARLTRELLDHEERSVFRFAAIQAATRVLTRAYAVERFDGVEVDRETAFEIPEDFDPDDLFEGRLGIWEPTDSPMKVELAFTGGAASVLVMSKRPRQSLSVTGSIMVLRGGQS